MSNISLQALAMLIAIVFVVEPIAVCQAQYWDGGIESAMKGHRLYNLFGEILGKIEGVTFNENGQPTFIILSVIGNKVVLVPFSALAPNNGLNRFVVDLSRRQLRNAPSYSINVFPYP